MTRTLMCVALTTQSSLSSSKQEHDSDNPTSKESQKPRRSSWFLVAFLAAARKPYDLEYLLLPVRVVGCGQLLDVAPAARVEFAKLMRLNPRDKGQKAPKRVRVHHLEQPGQRNEVHDDCFQPRDPGSTELFYTTADVQALTTDNKLRAVTCKAVLVDGGSEGNLVARYVVSALKASIVPVDIRCRVATGHDFRLSAIVWLQLTIEGVSSIIAATVVDGDPGYSIIKVAEGLSAVLLAGEDLLLILHTGHDEANAGCLGAALANSANLGKCLVFDTLQKIRLKKDSLEGTSIGIASPNDPSGGHEDAWTLNPHAIILCLSSGVKILKGIHIALVIFVKDQKKSDWEIYLPRPSKTLVDEHS
ncbi:hypothetical protein CNMCM8812_004496 [Aspergillus fumigatus]|nr:hypothetical protein CNMCM8714_001733 [Aspergillus fumigatus]KAF4262517.1 hypothetical protein CNMCM8812_004496 [Aspergillus fumigatus]KAH1372057.1 hypothetical protein KXX50_004561 [Aspergillus fumigatus]KAH1776151.1 hypothetical protein KXX62_000411 [Aspergillus fumigatus]KAH1782326.1 hypothetical protein KXX20_002290 [Aspergillus fumigatus]